MNTTTIDDPQLAQACSMVVEDPGIMGGMPTIHGTRVLVYDIAASVTGGMSPEQLQADHYTWLTLEQIELAVVYAKAFPPGPMPPAPPRPPGMRLIASRFFPAQHAGRDSPAIPD